MSKNDSLTDVLKAAFREYPDHEVIFDQYKRMTYRELYNDVQLISAALSKQGINKGDRVIVSLPNWHEFVVLYFSIAHIGAILVPCNTRYNSEEMSYIVENSEAKAAILSADYHVDLLEEKLQNKDSNSRLESIFTVRTERESLKSYQDLLVVGQKLHAPIIKIDPDEDVFSILYTSGTTGKPKGAMLTHSNVIAAARVTVEQMECTHEDVFLVAVPVFHVFGMVPSILSTVTAKAKMVFMERFKADEALKLIEQEKVSVYHGVPTMFILELSSNELLNYDLSSLRTGIIAAAPCPEEIVKKIRSIMGCNVVISYGLTESAASFTMTSFEDDVRHRTETVGKVLPGGDVKVVGAEREQLANGEIGELALRGIGVMKGYFKMEEETAKAIDHQGWFYTGDLATIDNQGYVRIVGRKKEMIIRGGYNIYPREIEELIYKHPSVLEVAIVGVADPVMGEVSVAVIKYKEGHRESSHTMKLYLKDLIAPYKIPDQFIHLDELPMTASGKIKKMALQEIIKGKIDNTKIR
ncbi:class I adenylate-forming enzyme family protein [Alkalihalobacillus sp. 1P02AB]|uniref:class I adenylate-forming enzyme family protein n=1 Tax=Alkalihalobacillus sp. 1P02AB TaxID=3132260 RepID=UPI0039A70D45